MATAWVFCEDCEFLATNFYDIQCPKCGSLNVFSEKESEREFKAEEDPSEGLEKVE